MLNRRRLFVSTLVCGLGWLPAMHSHAQNSDSGKSAPVQAASQSQDSSENPNFDPRKRRRSDKERYEAQKALRQELKGTYKKWLNEEVPYIITDQERKAFLSLSNDEERDAFIENFWRRRNPDPNSPENTYREEHYRRIAYANEHYAAGEPGWKTDRGRIYIMYGAPDSIDSHPGGGTYERPPDEGGGETVTFPFEVWHYRYIPGIGENINLEFVDTCQCGAYHFTIDRSEKDALLHVPGAGLTTSEMMGQSSKADRFRGGIESLGLGSMAAGEQGKEFDRIELAAKIFAPPQIKFKDLDAFVSEHKILSGPPFPFEVRTDFVKVTDNTDLVPITVQIRNRDITFVTKDGVSKGVVNILGKVTTITNRTIQTFEDTVEVDEPSELLGKSLDRESVYWKALPLQPGLYRLDIAIKDVNNPDHIGIYGRGINVPIYEDEKLGTSSLILADKMNTVSSHDIGNGNFVIGNTYIRPRVPSTPGLPVSFTRQQALNFWMQVYNLGINDATKSNSATVTYEITDVKNGNVLYTKTVPSKDLQPHSDELTIQKTLPIAGLAPGKYKVTVKVNDAISKQEVAQSAPFVVQ